jgi:hypothetical protein
MVQQVLSSVPGRASNLGADQHDVLIPLLTNLLLHRVVALDVCLAVIWLDAVLILVQDRYAIPAPPPKILSCSSSGKISLLKSSLIIESAPISLPTAVQIAALVILGAGTSRSGDRSRGNGRTRP